MTNKGKNTDSIVQYQEYHLRRIPFSRKLGSVEDAILALYAVGVSTRDISSQICKNASSMLFAIRWSMWHGKTARHTGLMYNPCPRPQQRSLPARQRSLLSLQRPSSGSIERRGMSRKPLSPSSRTSLLSTTYAASPVHVVELLRRRSSGSGFIAQGAAPTAELKHLYAAWESAHSCSQHFVSSPPEVE